MISSLPHHEDECQWSVSNFWCCLSGKQGIERIFELITEVWTASIGKNTKCTRKNTDYKTIDITNCKAFKQSLLHVEYTILIRYYYQAAKSRALYESRNGPAGQLAENPPSSDRLGDSHWTIPELTVQVYWQPGLPIWQWFGFGPDPDPDWRSGTVDNTSCFHELPFRLVPVTGFLNPNN